MKDGIEKKICAHLVRRALEISPYVTLSVYDSEEFAIRFSGDFNRVMDEIGETDFTRLIAFDGLEKREQIGIIDLVHGNEKDVIHDWSGCWIEIVKEVFAKIEDESL